VHFASFLSDGFISAIVVNLPERKLAKRTSVQCLHDRQLTQFGDTFPAESFSERTTKLSQLVLKLNRFYLYI
jgi:hypothetical protein